MYETFYGFRYIAVTGDMNPYAYKYLQAAETIAENPTGDIKLFLRSPGK